MDEQQFDPQDVEKNKVLAIVGYIFTILFFVPLVTEAKNSTYAKFHANQQLVLLIFGFAGGIGVGILSVVLVFIPLIGWMTSALLYAAYAIGYLVFMIMGILSASNGQTKKLPLIGGISLIK